MHYGAILGSGQPHGGRRFYLIPVATQLLTEAGLVPVGSEGATNCPEAKALHFEVKMASRDRVALAKLLIREGTRSIHLKESVMRAAEKASVEEGCFAASRESTQCRGCGTTR